MKRKHLIIAGTGLIVAASYFSCAKKPDVGFLSDNLLYSPYVFNAVKGRVTVSKPIQVDGSSGPINVKLLAIRNKYTGKPADHLLQEHEIAIYKGEITAADSTIELVNKKIGTGMYKTFNVNPIGGRLEVTPASNFVDTGTFVFDVEVSNMAGVKTLLKAGELKILPATNPYEITRASASTSPSNAESPTTGQTNYAVTITRIAGGENKIILKFVDKNGVPFNPAAGQIITRADRPYFDNYDPYYKVEKTDTALVFRYPEKLPTFPIYQYVSGGTNWAWDSYYRIPYTANDLNQNLNPVVGFRLWPGEGESVVKGTFIVTAKLNFATKK